MEKESGTVISATRSSMQMMRPVTATAATDDQELEGNKTTFLRTAETFLRLLPIGLCVSALVLMLKNSEENDYGSVSYTDLGAFRYLVNANGICAGYSLLSAVLIAVPRPTALRAWTFFFLDQVLTYIILSVGASTMEVVYLAENGDSTILWSSTCGSFGQFCHKITASVALTFVALVCYVLLSLISSYKLFSKFDVLATSSPAATDTDQ
ncbi:CASP-like protein 2A2 isoform X2 [Trifolium pratense]|uniref:CASP-like protein 2A2 isoform X2 n=1 Tax=Trifolium pratense TaxID=57577 RepID=UPI001E690A4B|nr:CASP-like protein 2A2 isoform X2 [Trifolium pratense]